MTRTSGATSVGLFLASNAPVQFIRFKFTIIDRFTQFKRLKFTNIDSFTLLKRFYLTRIFLLNVTSLFFFTMFVFTAKISKQLAAWNIYVLLLNFEVLDILKGFIYLSFNNYPT